MSQYSTLLIIMCCALLEVHGAATKPKAKFSPELTEMVRRVSRACYEETGADPGVFRVIEAGGYRTDAAFKRLIHCIYSKARYINEDGTPRVELDVASLPEEYRYVAETLRRCVSQQRDPVESIFQYFKCYQDQAPVRMDFCFDDHDPTVNYCTGQTKV